MQAGKDGNGGNGGHVDQDQYIKQTGVNDIGTFQSLLPLSAHAGRSFSPSFPVPTKHICAHPYPSQCIRHEGLRTRRHTIFNYLRETNMLPSRRFRQS